MRTGLSRPSRGFTLLEAIVALVLLASVGMALYAWLNQNLANVARMELAAARESATREALALLDAVNPMEQPEGRLESGSLQVHWRSQLQEPVRDGVSNWNSLGLYQLGLYKLQVRLYRDKESLGGFDLLKTGYKQVREYRADDDAGS